MLNCRRRPVIFSGFLFAIALAGCEAKPECDSSESRTAVLKTISEDSNNALAEYAAKQSNVAKSTIANPGTEKPRQPLYMLGDKIATTSTSADKLTLKCSGSISATIGDTKASKEVNFTVQRSEGKITVSVEPFRF